MIDLHHHLLFGIDDGSKDLATSVAMVEMAAADGVTHIVATPHANEEYPYDRERNAVLLQQIRAALRPDTAAKMQLGLGSDFHLSFENTEDIRTQGLSYAINQGPYVLVELADHGIPQRIDEVFYTMRVNGLIPILTHPERNTTLQRSRERLRSWMQADLLVQVTAGSLLGTFRSRRGKSRLGAPAQQMGSLRLERRSQPHPPLSQAARGVYPGQQTPRQCHRRAPLRHQSPRRLRRPPAPPTAPAHRHLRRNPHALARPPARPLPLIVPSGKKQTLRPAFKEPPSGLSQSHKQALP